LVPPSEGKSAGGDEAHCAFATEDIEARARLDRGTIANPVPPQFFFRDTDGHRFLIVQPN
jgi:hypothetical protein